MSSSDARIAQDYITLITFEAMHWDRLSEQGVCSINSWHDPATARIDLFAVKMDDGTNLVFDDARKCMDYLKVLVKLA